MRLIMKNGREGPRFDPYSYTERIVKNGRNTVILHDGLGIWISVNGKRLRVSEERAEELFFKLTKLTSRQFDRAYNKVHGPHCRCQKCGCKHLDAVSGYPGEAFELCHKCGSFVNSYFNEAAII